MATIGLRDLYIAKITEDAQTGNETFGTPKQLAKMISAKLAVTTADGTLYADDGVDEEVSEFSSGTLTLGVNDLADADVGEMLGATVDETSGVVYSGFDDEPPYYAVGFRAKKPGGMFRYIWLYKVKFKIPGAEFATKGEKIEFKTPEIEGTFITLNKNGRWKADKAMLSTDAVAAAWFNKVQEPAAS